MAVTRGHVWSETTRSLTGTSINVSHTVEANTTLLVVSTFYEAGETVTATPQWSLGGGENLTLVDETTRSGSNNDMCVSTYALVNPTAGAGTVTVTHSSNDNAATTAINYAGTNTSATMSENIALIAEDVNDAATNTTVFSSGGTAGNTLYAAGGFKGGDGDGITPPTGFVQLADNATGTSTAADISFFTCDKLNGAADSCTWTWAASDENAAHYLEIFPPDLPAYVAGTVTQLDHAAQGDADNPSYSISAGTDRILVVGVANEGTADDTISVTWGGQSMTKAVQVYITGGSVHGSSQLFYLLEAGIAAGSGTTIAITGEDTDFIWSACSYQGADQTGGATTIPETASAQVEASTPNPYTTIDIAGGTGSMVVAMGMSGGDYYSSWGGTNPLTKQTGFTDDAITVSGSYGHRAIASSETADVELTWSTQNRRADVAMEIAPEPAAASVRPQGPLGHVFIGPFGGPL